ncbi:MAG: YbaB/EbfC family nucleoid-associated protein [SAR202 cluster bacterium]|nr:YbaB/EbfC family nucleoid-associated protein [SAR202 cluster bacterium]
MNKRMLQQAQQMQARLARIQQEIAEAKTEATSGGGAVKAVVLGGTRLESLTISPEAVQAGDAEMLQDLVMAAVNEAMDMAQAEASKKMAAVTGGLNIPGLF